MVFFRREEYPWRFSPLSVEGGPSPPVSGRRCAVGLVCIESSVQGVYPEDEKDSWDGSGWLLVRSRSRVPLNKWSDDSESPPPVWALWGHGDLDGKYVFIKKTVLNINIKSNLNAVRFSGMKSKQKLSPVMITSAARQANKEMSKFMRCRLWEKSMMESIQSPKLRTHCSRWRTTPLQKISLFFSGLDLHSFKSREQSAYWKVHMSLMKQKLMNRSCWEQPTCMRVAEWRAQQRLIRGAAPGPLCRNLWIPGWFQPRFLSHPKSPSAGHKTAGCHKRLPFLSGWQLSPGTEGEEVGRVNAIVQNCKHPQWAAHCLSF